MRVFVSFGYTDEEAWVRDLAMPLLQQLGIYPIDGVEIAGTEIDDAIHARIRSADALVAFLLPRRESRDGTYEASDYVRDEIHFAIAEGKPVVQVVHHQVRPIGGFAGKLQRIPYHPNARDRFLVDLARHLRAWTEGEVKVRLAPDALVRALGRQGRTECHYTILHEHQVEREARADIVPEGGGMFTKLFGFRPGRHAELRVTVKGAEWSSRFHAYDQPFTNIQLKRI